MVEIMFNKELSDVAFDIDALDEWKKIAKELGLENQLALTKGDNSPIPYPFMNEIMNRVYDTLCPNHVEFKKYKNTTIPLEVMKQISFSIKELHFQKIEIWANDKEPHPLVIGLICQFYTYDLNGERTKEFNSREEIELAYPKEKRKNNYDIYETNQKKYLIARWGDELRDFAELKTLAIKSLTENVGGELDREIKTKTEKFKLLKENINSYFNGNMNLYDVKG